MRTRLLFIGATFAVVSLLCIGPNPAYAGEHEEAVRGMQDATLKGINVVPVSIEPVEPNVEKDGLTTRQLRTDVELRLRKAGIIVAPAAQGQTEYLYVRVTAAKSGLHIYGYSVEVSLKQWVSLMRNPQVHAYAATWDRVSSGTAAERDFASTARESAADILDEFINAYLAQNPKR